MLSRVNTVAFNGLEILNVELQVQISAGLPAFTIVGLPDKAVAESRERIRAAFTALGLKLPAKRITVNLMPADLLKEGSHYDLPLALGLLAGMEVIPTVKLAPYFVLGELGLDGRLADVNGILPAALAAKKQGFGIICPENQGSEAVWAGLKDILAASSLLQIINFFQGNGNIPFPVAKRRESSHAVADLKDVRGQETAKRALEIAAAGAHNLIMSGPPGAGKSMLAARLPSILPPMTTAEAIETSMIHSVAGELKDGSISFERPFRDPHHSASTPALVGGGRKARPGEISLAHNGVLFLDELPEFSRASLEALRQPLENGCISISRVNSHTVFPARFQLVAAMNPCRCGNLGISGLECSRAPKCGEEYRAKISGPLLDRIDIQIEVPAVNPFALASAAPGESSAAVRARVVAAREIQKERFAAFGRPDLLTNAQLSGELLEKAAVLDNEAQKLLLTYAERNRMSARAYHRTLRLARTIADLQNENKLLRIHVAEALSLRWKMPDRKLGDKK